jgi:hypothetical protein
MAFTLVLKCCYIRSRSLQGKEPLKIHISNGTQILSMISNYQATGILYSIVYQLYALSSPFVSACDTC